MMQSKTLSAETAQDMLLDVQNFLSQAGCTLVSMSVAHFPGFSSSEWTAVLVYEDGQ